MIEKPNRFFHDLDLWDIVRSGIFTVDNNLKITRWNKAAEAITGFTKEEIIGKSCKVFCDNHSCTSIDPQICCPGMDLNGYFQKKDGSKIKVKKIFNYIYNDKGCVDGGVESFEHADQIQEQFYSLMDLPTDAIIMINNEGYVEYWNKAAYKIFGYRQDEAMGKDIGQLIVPSLHQESFKRGVDTLKESGENETNYRVFELEAQRKDGVIFPVEISIAPMKTEKGWGVIGIVRDMTEKKAYLYKEMQLQQQVYQSAKLASIGLLAAGVAHEINNPLAIIQGHLELLNMYLIQKGVLDEKMSNHLNTQQIAVDRINNIVLGLNNYARLDHMIDEPVDLNQAVIETSDLLGILFTKSEIKVTLSLSEERIFFKGNIGKIKQVIMNFLTNARDALEKKKDKLVEISTYRENNHVILKISDNGKGISSKDTEKIFDNFYTTKAAGKGTGLGLSIAHSIIKDFNGDIKLNSIENKGTTFYVILPILDDRKLNNLQPIANRMIDDSRLSGKIVLVEDEIQLREMYEYYLDALGLMFKSFSNGVDAINYLEENDDVDVLLTDLKMPLMDGLTLIKRVVDSGRSKTLKIIIMTGGVDLNNNLDASTYSFDGLLYKPFGKEELFEELSKYLSLISEVGKKKNNRGNFNGSTK